MVSASDNNAEKIKSLIRDRILKNRLAPGAGNASLTSPVLTMTQSLQDKIVEPEVKLKLQLPPSRSSKPLKQVKLRQLKELSGSSKPVSSFENLPT